MPDFWSRTVYVIEYVYVRRLLRIFIETFSFVDIWDAFGGAWTLKDWDFSCLVQTSGTQTYLKRAAASFQISRLYKAIFKVIYFLWYFIDCLTGYFHTFPFFGGGGRETLLIYRTQFRNYKGHGFKKE